MGAGHAKEGSGGYRIVRICPEGPVSECDMEIFFDYIVQIEDVKLQDASRKTYESFMQKVREGENKEVRLLVYSCRYDKLKEVHVKPRKWRGKGLLGMNISYEKANAMKEGIQIVRIEDGYLDIKNKITEKEDIIIGHGENILRNFDELCNFVEGNLFSYHGERKKAPLELSFYVYNKVRGDVRMVNLKVDPTWGRHGLLGCHLSEMNASLEEGRGEATLGGSHEMGRVMSSEMGRVMSSEVGRVMSSEMGRVMSSEMGQVMNREMNHEMNPKMNRELTQEATPYEKCIPPEHVSTAEWTKDLPGETIEWGAEPSVGSKHIRFGRNEANGEEAAGEDPGRPNYGRLNTHYFRDGRGAGALGSSMSSSMSRSLGSSLDRSLGNSPGGAQDHKGGGEKSYALSSTIEVEVEVEAGVAPGVKAEAYAEGKHVKQAMQPSQKKHTLHTPPISPTSPTSPTSQEWHPPQEQPPPDQRDTPAERYERYVKNIKTYSKEMLDVYRDMDENGRLLEELKLRTLRNFSLGGKLVGGECDYVAGEVSVPEEAFADWGMTEGDTNERSGTCEVEVDGKSQGGDGLLM
ncbi:hypothetical protein PCYB_061160 [Plasmodium cynomolgi strain B]|uniref:PDZ GRASP-type domain-containing protein n=1 Tax=Plasmodium cynomolgi (strain B) TaxID=1120755 RepID=K6UQW5_PLACD|nr:hypothetical protein PCYB_061160 [Plasmodium cynomolgi strain B]GAB65384.1 hypothetical protein PCYB_061160 [Plasmodium cynomolgi strain B]